MNTIRTKTILFVDDDPFFTRDYVDSLLDAGYRVLLARSVAEARQMIGDEKIDLAILDLMMPLGEDLDPADPDLLSAHGGYLSGQVLASWISRTHPGTMCVGFSCARSVDVTKWFEEHAAGLLSKSKTFPRDLVARVGQLLDMTEVPGPQSFIVHGHDEGTKYELKNYLQNTLGLPEPVVLHEQPSHGRTIIEKFETESSEADLVFVLLTPDDVLAEPHSSNDNKRRARQNVILELGYFLGKMGRKSGRIVLLFKGPLEIPSDISGLVYVDVSSGIDAAGEAIRREIEPLLASRSTARDANKRMQPSARRRR